jgi:hypothetical protein
MNKAPQENSAIYWKPIKRLYHSKLNKKACLTQKKFKICTLTNQITSPWVFFGWIATDVRSVMLLGTKWGKCTKFHTIWQRWQGRKDATFISDINLVTEKGHIEPTPMSTPSNECPLLLHCAWTFTELTFDFIFLTNSGRNRFHIRVDRYENWYLLGK